MSEENNELSLQEQLDELEKNPLLQGDGVHYCSDDTVVNVRSTTRNIKTKIMHLEESEQEEILAMNSEFRVLMGRKIILKRKLEGGSAYKKNVGWQKCLERSEELMDLFGKMYSAQEVHQIIVTEWGYTDVKYESVGKYQRENIDTITQLRDKYQKDVTNVRLTHKRSRLDELTELYGSRKLKYEHGQSRSDYELMLKTLEQIRKEVEGQRITINGVIQHEHEVAVQEHVNSEIIKHLNINDIIVSRLCARLGVNPKYILYRLHTSYYKKFTGFLPQELSDSNEIQYPSQIVYDFPRIAQLNNTLNIQDVEYKEEPETSDPLKSNKIKELLLQKIKEKKENLSQQRNTIDNIDGKLK